MTDFTEAIEVDGSDVPGATSRFTMDQLEFVEWWDDYHPATEIKGCDLLQRVLSSNGCWVVQRAWRFRRRII